MCETGRRLKKRHGLAMIGTPLAATGRTAPAVAATRDRKPRSERRFGDKLSLRSSTGWLSGLRALVLHSKISLTSKPAVGVHISK
ncbi:hypothetical protein MPNT_430011 [Candidatus Methylacidithermus pantelleriae]|uniref:Uncharacterized protein n=1 Tax=Candidatus Methylacidithermus pantelleriae TaxID=2744239 RepID=A0A8J2BPQ6_9BACT|nr:hypothetical protein MPNT_430011 [Candidatus Methylacidithermus pantelleriae]